MRNVVISEAAKASARAAGIFGDVSKRLARMARRSAPFTGEYGNRRFNDFVMFIDDGVLIDVVRLELETAIS